MKPWKPGEPLAPGDEALLDGLRERARALGRSPKVSETPDAARLKARFGLWKRALQAAGLPGMNDPEQVRLREREKR